MKSPAAYYLMLLYITVMFKPLIPVISDFWSHEFDEIEHISTVHAKYGSHHLQKEVSDTNTDNNQKTQSTLKTDEQVSFHLLSDNCCSNLSESQINKQFHSFINSKILTVAIAKQGPPPKFSW